ncbi:hypothetical protein T190607A02C_250001 [Tenacibaculum sp. 190524A02b]
MNLSAYVNTDSQNLTNASLSGTDLTIEIENGASVSVDLAPLVSNLQSELSTAQNQITALQTQMNDVLARLQSIENCACDGTLSTPTTSLNKIMGPKLYQNIPNPFTSTSSIKYYLPHDVSKAYMVFSDAIGKIISKIELEERGEAELDINSNGLPSGTYHYTLYVGTQKVASKRMIIE